MLNAQQSYGEEEATFASKLLGPTGESQSGTPREITNARAEVVWSSTFKTYGALARFNQPRL